MNDWAPPALPHRSALLLSRASGVAGLIGLLGLCACSGSLLPKPATPAARHALETGAAASPPPKAGPASGAAAHRTGTLMVEPPRAAPGYDSRRMVYQRTPGQLEAFALHEWVAPPADLLAPLLVRALQDAGGDYAVLPAPSAATADWRLETQLLSLIQDFSVQPSRLRLSLRTVLLEGRRRRVLGWREVQISLPVAGDDPVAGATAAQAAALQAAQAVAAFCVEQLRTAPLPQPQPEP
jgi:cholesterol transport system auxiliary component